MSTNSASKIDYVSNERPDSVKRTVAFLVDLAITWIVSSLIPVIGGLLGWLYFLFKDALHIGWLDGRSVGKKLMQMRVVDDEQQPITAGASFRRNIPLSFVVIGMFFCFIPFLGYLLYFAAVICQIVVFSAEAYRIIKEPSGRRIGDLIAESQVINSEE